MATLLVFSVYLFLRRFRAGSQLDGALIVASSVAMIGFARAASTDMPLTAMFGISAAGVVCMAGDRRKALARLRLFLPGAGDTRKGTRRTVSGAADYSRVLPGAARLQSARAHVVAAGSRDLFRCNAAVVPAGRNS